MDIQGNSHSPGLTWPHPSTSYLRALSRPGSTHPVQVRPSPLFLETVPAAAPLGVPQHSPQQLCSSQFSSWGCTSRTLLNLGEQEENWRISRQPSSLTSSSSSESTWWYRSERAGTHTTVPFRGPGVGLFQPHQTSGRPGEVTPNTKLRAHKCLWAQVGFPLLPVPLVALLSK